MGSDNQYLQQPAGSELGFLDVCTGKVRYSKVRFGVCLVSTSLVFQEYIAHTKFEVNRPDRI